MTLLPEVRRQLNEAAERQAQRRPVWRRGPSFSRATVGRRPSISFAHLALVASVVVVGAVAAAFLSGRGSNPTTSRKGTVVRIVFRADPTPQRPLATNQALERTVEILRRRLRSAFSDLSVTASPGQSVTVVVRHGGSGARARILALSAPARLDFYDWEANALTPNGKSVASQLAGGKPDSTLISQGSAGSAPGSPGAGSMSLYAAVKLASRQRNPPIGSFNARRGPLYYLFGAPGSAACASAGRFSGFAPVAGQHCLLSGPQPTVQGLRTELPSGVDAAHAETLSVPQGIAVVQAVSSDFARAPGLSDPNSQFFVLTDHAAVLGSEVTHPHASNDAAGSPDVSFGFTRSGNSHFEAVTGRIAKRGALQSGSGEQLNQHFSVVLDERMITVPSIDFRQYPDGIIGGGGADITAGFTTRSARDLATQLRFGALPLRLTATS